ncbi:ATP phosphoribosyltransferase regulatory subunit [Frisingicoccus caecimuris]|uniref:ATP phosphoribosyltransferase regulatory subunit n=1 Tax=Frisingicoccus caecimuris TaxID=1796636 RepID=A0A4R2LQG0_9FIRM|nr:ATP phosphoribosyltransferase regulatory subunit [Frisingicoccus caecimuris]MCR1918684.1 ATP phosphoribosyltransferase regulatory subunit [Frisingicoccus caecimuris]TCO86316.1 ATP phosphoribosyltransferase regulatory subunit [Frisingicoccus caecimuris]
MKERRIHTPEGVRDIYNGECARKNHLSDRMKDILKSYGYRDIQTPTFEFFDIFNQDKGSLPSNQMYKFFDREGNTLVLRPDITPSIARAVSKYFSEENFSMRFSYTGNIFINNSSLQGRMKESTQMGAELIGDDSIDADAEMIALAIHLLLAAGLTEFQIDVGHVGFFKGLIEEAGMDEEKTQELRELIENKNFFGVEAMTDNPALIRLPKLFGSQDILKEAKRLTSNMKALVAITRLERLYEIIGEYGLQKYVTFDLGMLTQYDYYTGVIFRGYTYGTGDAVVKGGRYDTLLQKFGKDAASVGLAVAVDELLIALSRQKIDVDEGEPVTMILYSGSKHSEALKKAKELREKGGCVQMNRMDSEQQLEDYMAYAKRFHIADILYFNPTGEMKILEVQP